MSSIQAIINARSIFPRGLYQPSGSFRFSVDGLLLASFMAGLELGHSGTLVGDFGAGCGVVGLAFLLKHPEAYVIGLEKQEILVEAANANATLLGYGERYVCLRVDLTLDDVLEEGFFERAVRKNAGINARLMLENMPAETCGTRVSDNLLFGRLPSGNLASGNGLPGNMASGNGLSGNGPSGNGLPGKLTPEASCSGAFGPDKSGYGRSCPHESDFGELGFRESGLDESASNESASNASGYGRSCLGERVGRTGSEGFDIIVANPPYRILGHGRLPQSLMRQQALFAPAGTVEKFCEAAWAMLAPRGLFGVVFPADEEDSIRRAMAYAGFRLERVLRVYGREGKPATLVLLAGRKMTAETSCPAGGGGCANRNSEGRKSKPQDRRPDNGGIGNCPVEDYMPAGTISAGTVADNVLPAEGLLPKELSPKATLDIGMPSFTSGSTAGSTLDSTSGPASDSFSGHICGGTMMDDYMEEPPLILYDKDNRLSLKAIDFCPFLG